MTKIDLEFECTAPEGKCAWKDSLGECITTDENDESWVCWYLRAKVKTYER